MVSHLVSEFFNDGILDSFGYSSRNWILIFHTNISSHADERNTKNFLSILYESGRLKFGCVFVLQSSACSYNVCFCLEFFDLFRYKAFVQFVKIYQPVLFNEALFFQSYRRPCGVSSLRLLLHVDFLIGNLVFKPESGPFFLGTPSHPGIKFEESDSEFGPFSFMSCRWQRIYH